MLPPRNIYTLRSLLRLFLATNTILWALLVCLLHVHMKAIKHANNWSLTLAFQIFNWAQVNFTWAQAWVGPGVATPLDKDGVEHNLGKSAWLDCLDCILNTRSSLFPVLHHLQYANTEEKGLGLLNTFIRKFCSPILKWCQVRIYSIVCTLVQC